MVVTLADIADACNTSISTVSRALSDPGKVNAATRGRIQRTARAMGYAPNPIARSLSMGRTGTIGLIVPDIANPFFPPIIKAAQTRAVSRQAALLIADTNDHPSDELVRVRAMINRVDGIILVSPRSPDGPLREVARLAPMVLLNRQLSGVPCVAIEDSDGIDQAIEHLTALGHRHICYLNGPRRSWSNQQWHKAIVASCKSRKLKLTEFGPFEPQLQAGVRAADLLHASGATAVIAYDDVIALGVMARLAERGLRAGVDMSVVGIDDSPMSAVAYPSLTTIHVPKAEGSGTAIDMLLDMLDGISGHGVTSLETRLIVRGSTGPAPR